MQGHGSCRVDRPCKPFLVAPGSGARVQTPPTVPFLRSPSLCWLDPLANLRSNASVDARQFERPRAQVGMRGCPGPRRPWCVACCSADSASACCSTGTCRERELDRRTPDTLTSLRARSPECGVHRRQGPLRGLHRRQGPLRGCHGPHPNRRHGHLRHDRGNRGCLAGGLLMLRLLLLLIITKDTKQVTLRGCHGLHPNRRHGHLRHDRRNGGCPKGGF